MHGAAEAPLGCWIMSPQGKPQSTRLQGQELACQLSVFADESSFSWLCSSSKPRTAPQGGCSMGLRASKPQLGEPISPCRGVRVEEAPQGMCERFLPPGQAVLRGLGAG